MLKRKSVSKYKVLTQQTECVCVCVCACNTGQKGRIAILERRLVSNLRPEGGLGTVTFNYSTVSDPVALDFTASSTSKLSTKSTTTVLLLCLKAWFYRTLPPPLIPIVNVFVHSFS